MMSTVSLAIRRHLLIHPRLEIPILLIIAAVLAFIVTDAVPAGAVSDFDIFRNAGVVLRTGGNPYADPAFYSPIILLVYFAPLSLLSREIGLRVTTFLAAAIYLAVIYKVSRRHLNITLLAVASPLFLYSVFCLNVEWIPFLGLLVAPELAIILALTKPQVGLVVAAVAIWMLIRSKRWRPLIALAVFETAVFGLSLSMGMTWSDASSKPWNVSLFPLSLIVGIPLAVLALVRREQSSALAAAPLLSPYVGPSSPIALLPITAKRWWTIVLFDAIAWLVVIFLATK